MVKHRTSTATAEGSRFITDVQDYTAGQSERQESIQKLVRAYERSRLDPKHEHLNKLVRHVDSLNALLEQSITGL